MLSPFIIFPSSFQPTPVTKFILIKVSNDLYVKKYNGQFSVLIFFYLFTSIWCRWSLLSSRNTVLWFIYHILYFLPHSYLLLVSSLLNLFSSQTVNDKCMKVCPCYLLSPISIHSLGDLSLSHYLYAIFILMTHNLISSPSAFFWT